MKVAFFQCPRCHEWRYSTKSISKSKQYKCLKCGYMINFKVVKKEIYEMPNRPHLKVQVLKEIKARGKEL